MRLGAWDDLILPFPRPVARVEARAGVDDRAAPRLEATRGTRPPKPSSARGTPTPIPGIPATAGPGPNSGDAASRARRLRIPQPAAASRAPTARSNRRERSAASATNLAVLSPEAASVPRQFQALKPRAHTVMIASALIAICSTGSGWVSARCTTKMRQPLKDALCAAPGTATRRWLGKWRPICSPQRGGVTGSCTSDRMSAGAAEVTPRSRARPEPAGHVRHQDRQRSA